MDTATTTDYNYVSSSDESIVSTSDWIKGISLSILASMIGGASKLMIRKSWLLEQHEEGEGEVQQEQQHVPLTTIDPVTLSPGAVSNATSTPHDDSHLENRLDTTGIYTNPPPFTSPRYVPLLLRTSGMIGMTIFNPLCSVLAMNYASPSILAPFSGLTLVWIVLGSNTFVQEIPTLQQIIAVICIIIGEIIIAIFGDHTNDTNTTIHDVIQSYQKLDFIIFIIVLLLWIIYLLYYMCQTTTSSSSSSITFQRFAWGVAGGLITGLQNFLKDALTILKNISSSKDNNNHNNTSLLIPHLLLFSMFFTLAIITALTGLIILTLCMKRYDVTYSASMFVGSFCISASIMSAIHYNTFQHLNHNIIQYIAYPVGLIILLIGVYLLLISASSIRNISSNNTDHNNDGTNHLDYTLSNSLITIPHDDDDNNGDAVLRNNRTTSNSDYLKAMQIPLKSIVGERIDNNDDVATTNLVTATNTQLT